jgi:hypothetical protein
LIRLCLVDENKGRLTFADLGRERFQALPKTASLNITNKDEVAAVLRRHMLHARDR